MSESKRDEVDWATAAEQSSEEDEAQEGNTEAHDVASDEPAEERAMHSVDEVRSDDEVEAGLEAALDAMDVAADPEADAIVDDSLEIDSTDESEAAVAALDDEEADEEEEANAEAAEETQGLVVTGADANDEESEAAVDAAIEAGVAGDADVATDVDTDAEAEPADPYEEFRAELKAQPGNWYVIHSYAGFERRVKANIENRKASLEAEDFIFQVEVPMEDVVEIKNGQRKMVTRVRIPGYVLVRMELNEDSWSVVRHTPGVTGFVGNSHNPTPLRFEEAFSMLKSLVQVQAVPTAKGVVGKGGKAANRVIPAEIDFEIGETITIKEGSFTGLPGSINEIKPESGKLIVLVSLFERETPVELSFDQVSKL